MGSVFKYIAVQKLTSPTSVISNKVIVTKERNKVSLCFRVSLCCQYLTLVCRGNISLGLSFLSKLCKLFFNFKEAKIVEEKKYINNSRDVLIYYLPLSRRPERKDSDSGSILVTNNKPHRQ